MTREDLLPILASAEILAYEAQLLDLGQPDPVAAVLAASSAMVREAIRSHADNVLDPDPAALPEAGIYWAAIIARNRIAARLEDTLPETWRTEYQEAMSWLRDVRAGRVAIESAASSEDASGPTPTPQISGRTHAYGRTSQDGI